MIGALFVPLSECSHEGKERAAAPPPKTLAQRIFPHSNEQTDYDYGATRLGLSENGVLTLIAFGWPLVLALCNPRVAAKRRSWILYTVELLLSAGTIYWIYEVTRFATRLWGAFLVFALVAVYAFAALLDLWRNITAPPARN